MKREDPKVWWRVGVGLVLFVAFDIARDPDVGLSHVPGVIAFAAVAGLIGVVILRARDRSQPPPPSVRDEVQPSPLAAKTGEREVGSEAVRIDPSPLHDEPGEAVLGPDSSAPPYDQFFQSRVHVWMLKWMGLAFAFLCIVILPVVHPNWPWILGGALLAFASLRYSRAGIWIGPAGVRLVRLFRTEKFGWDQVERFSVGFSGTARIELTGGGARRIFAVQGYDTPVRAQGVDGAQIVDELNRLAGLYKTA